MTCIYEEHTKFVPKTVAIILGIMIIIALILEAAYRIETWKREFN